MGGQSHASEMPGRNAGGGEDGDEQLDEAQVRGNVELVYSFADFAAEMDHEMQLRPGDVVMALDKHENGWWQGVVVWRGDEPKPTFRELDQRYMDDWISRLDAGWFPCTFVATFEDALHHADHVNDVLASLKSDDDPFSDTKVKQTEGLMKKGLSFLQAKLVVLSLDWIFGKIAQDIDERDAKEGSTPRSPIFAKQDDSRLHSMSPNGTDSWTNGADSRKNSVQSNGADPRTNWADSRTNGADSRRNTVYPEAESGRRREANDDAPQKQMPPEGTRRGSLKEESVREEEPKRNLGGREPRHEQDYAAGAAAENLPVRPMSAKFRGSSAGGGGDRPGRAQVSRPGTAVGSRPGTAIQFRDVKRGDERGNEEDDLHGEEDDELGVYQDMGGGRPVSRGGSTVRFTQALGGGRRPDSRGSHVFDSYAPGIGSTIITFQGQVVSCFALPGDDEHAVYIGETMRVRPGVDESEQQSFDHPTVGLQGGDATSLQPHGLGMVLFGTEDAQSRARFRGTFDRGCMTGLGIMEWQDGAKYCGAWNDSLPHGYGEERYPDGSIFQGSMKHDLRHGIGTLMQPYRQGNKGEVAVCAGEWRMGMQHGVAIDMVEDASRKRVGAMMFSLYRKGEILQSANAEECNVSDLQAQVLASRQRGTEAKSRALEIALQIMEMTKPFEID